MGFSHHIMNKDAGRAEKTAFFKGFRIEHERMQNFDPEGSIRLEPRPDARTASRDYKQS